MGNRKFNAGVIVERERISSIIMAIITNEDEPLAVRRLTDVLNIINSTIVTAGKLADVIDEVNYPPADDDAEQMAALNREYEEVANLAPSQAPFKPFVYAT